MGKSFTRFIGLRYTGSAKRSQMVSFISGISIAGLSLGVGLLLTVLSVMNGFERELKDKILGVMPQGALYHRYGIEDWKTLSEQVTEHPKILAAAPFVELQGMIIKGQQVVPAGVFGISPREELKVSKLDQFVDRDALASLTQQPDNLLLGQGIAQTLGVSQNDRIRLLVPSQEDSRRAPKFRTFSIAGLVSTNTELDHALVIVPLASASELSAHPDKVSGLRILSEDLFGVPQTLYELITELPYGYFASDWTRTHGNLFHAIQMSKNLVGLLLFLIIAIAAFNVVSTLVMVVVDKQADIAILKTLGASRADILSIFMVQGSMIGLIGTSLGMVIGYLGANGAQALVAGLERFFDVQFLNSEVYPVNYIPSEIWLSDFVLVAVASLLLSFLATLYPAWMASRVEPSEALRYEH